jgi:hypothetical protein
MSLRENFIERILPAGKVRQGLLSVDGEAGPHRGLPPEAGAAGRSADVASHRLKQHLNRHPVPDWVHQQVYWHSCPKELMLRNHV